MMMLIYIVLILLILIVIFLLLMPVRLVINTELGCYYLQLKGLLKASLLGDEEELLKLRVSNWIFKYEFYPLRYKRKNKKQTDKEIGHTKSSRKGTNNLKTIRRLIQSFKVKRFYLNIDTGDVILNSKLFPAFALLRFYKANVHVNYLGRNSLILVIENRPIRLIKSFINI